MDQRNNPNPAVDKEDEARRLQFLPWEHVAGDLLHPAHLARKAALQRACGAELAETAFIAEHAAVFTERLKMGERSWIAGHALVRGDITFGDDCTVNPYACISGKVACGNGVRVASHASIVGFNHGFDDTSLPIHRQKVTTTGITIGDDVWIAADAFVGPRVQIGRGSVVGARSVVVRDVAPQTVVAGNPARPIKPRKLQKQF